MLCFAYTVPAAAAFSAIGYLASLASRHGARPGFIRDASPGVGPAPAAGALRMAAGDAAAVAAPGAPVEFFTLPGNTCPFAQRTLMTLHELRIPFNATEVSMQPTKPEWYLKINPRGLVPALRVPSLGSDFIVHESAICNEFLCDYSTVTLKQGATLMPSDAGLRARVRLLNHHCDTVLTPMQFTTLMNKDEGKEGELLGKLEDALVTYEDALRQSGGPYLLGEAFTLADVHILPFILRMTVTMKHYKQYELPEARFPRLRSWFATCSARDSMRQSSMSDERIIEVYDRFMAVNYKFGGLNKNA